MSLRLAIGQHSEAGPRPINQDFHGVAQPTDAHGTSDAQAAPSHSEAAPAAVATQPGPALRPAQPVSTHTAAPAKKADGAAHH